MRNDWTEIVSEIYVNVERISKQIIQWLKAIDMLNICATFTYISFSFVMTMLCLNCLQFECYIELSWRLMLAMKWFSHGIITQLHEIYDKIEKESKKNVHDIPLHTQIITKMMPIARYFSVCRFIFSRMEHAHTAMENEDEDKDWSSQVAQRIYVVSCDTNYSLI